MRTTLTIDDDVAALLREKRRKHGGKLKDLINEALRRGLAPSDPPSKRRRPFRTRAVSLGVCRVASLDDVAEALAVGEGDAFR
jgi:hypothetical protein